MAVLTIKTAKTVIEGSAAEPNANEAVKTDLANLIDSVKRVVSIYREIFHANLETYLHESIIKVKAESAKLPE